MSIDNRSDSNDITKLHLWQIQWVRDLAFIILIVCGVWVGYAMRDITIPLLVALLLAYLFEPLIAFFADNPKFPLGRIPVISGILTLLTISVLLILAVTIPLVVAQTTGLVNDVQNGKLRSQLERVTQNYAPESVKNEILHTLNFLPNISDSSTYQEPSELMSNESMDPIASSVVRVEDTHLPAVTENARSGLVSIAQTTGDVAYNVATAIVHFAMLAVLIPFYFFFFSLWFPKVKEFAASLIPDGGKNDTVTLLKKMDAAVAGFVRGRIVIAFIMGVLLAIVWMVIGVPYAILLGIGIGFLCAVPFLGLVGIPLSIGLLYLEQLGVSEASRMEWWAILLWPALIFGVVQALDGWLLTPLIAGKATNLDPVTIFVAVLAGGSVLGVYGMLLAVPIAACIKILIQDRLLPKVHAWARGEVDDPLPFDD